MNQQIMIMIIVILILSGSLMVLKISRRLTKKLADNDKQKFLEYMPESELKEMDSENPYRTGVMESRRYQDTWSKGWIRGKYYSAHKILEYAHKKNIPKEELRELLEFVTGYEFKNKERENNTQSTV